MYYDTIASDLSGSFGLSSALQGTFNNRKAETNQRQIQPLGRRVLTNCFSVAILSKNTCIPSVYLNFVVFGYQQTTPLKYLETLVLGVKECG